MTFASTRSPHERVTFQEAVFRGLAPDGGLYHPVERPDLSRLFRELPAAASFLTVAARLIAALLPEIGDPATLAARAFPFEPRLARATENIDILELFHGPSSAFKDFGASFLATVMEEFLRDEKQRAVVLTATSGDTGSAVARAFYGKRNISVVVLYPSGRVSPLQEKQLTTLGGNITALEVKGSFDDCQRMVKEAFVDPDLSARLTLTSANSINLGRLLPQSFYYVWAWSRLRDRRPSFCVPSGNFGNLTAGLLAWQWGLPVGRFIAATNRNDVVPEYLKTSRFQPRTSVLTYSNAMDVGNPSNFERLLAIFEGSWEKMREMVAEEVVTDEETVATIKRVHESLGLILDPHTAVGYLAAERYLARPQAHRAADPARPVHVVTLATAHPGKFLEIVEETIGVRPPLPQGLAELMSRPKESTVIGTSLRELSQLLLAKFS